MMAENRMELFIETLTGTAFELSCSPLETIVSIKAKIQYSEGIPVSQQHLIWKSQELNDDLCLQDYCIKDGATLKLVLGMRGGPINTRQVSDAKKLKDLADYVERSSETAGSSGRPFTVLVFHDGDKVHMYTLMERGECTVSPLSGTISETSSIASVKNIEELDQEIAKENEATREKIAQLQEQLRSLNINRSKKLPSTTAATRHCSIPAKTVTEKPKEEFFLPPIRRMDTYNSQSKQYLPKNAQTKLKADLRSGQFSSGSGSVTSLLTTSNEEHGGGKEYLEKDIRPAMDLISNPKESSKASSTLDYISNSITTYVLSSPDKTPSDESSQSCSNFLPYIASVEGGPSLQRKPLPRRPSQNSQVVALNLDSLDSILKYDPPRVKKTHKQTPLTSTQALSSRKLVDLDAWLQNRPKTSPAKSTCRSVMGEKGSRNRADRSKRRLKHSISNPFSISVSNGSKSGLMMQMFTDSSQDVSFKLSPGLLSKNKSNEGSLKNTAEPLISPGIKALKPGSLNDSGGQPNSIIFSNMKSTKASPKQSEDLTRPSSGKKLPVIKTKKKSHKRCSLCSKKTGLATSYICRCGKNFCATHRYAEVHHCSYDYKTEGRRLLQLNNPVVAASKLPKI